MRNSLKICFIAPEVSPFVKGGPLAEIAGTLPIALKEMGHDVRVIMPNYKAVNERKYVLRDVIRLKDMDVQLGSQTIKVSAKSAFLPDSKVQIYFIDHKGYFGREGLYRDPKSGKEYPDNDERFAAFCLGCVQTLRVLHWQPDVIHCFEWPTGFFPLIFKTLFQADEFFQKTHIAFSFDDFENLALFPQETLQKIGIERLPNGELSGIITQNKISLLKAGILASDLLLFNSESFVQEMLEQELVQKELAETLKANLHKVAGVVPGIPVKEWDPETDVHLPINYSSRSIGKKNENKKALLTEIKMPYQSGTPLLGFVAPLEPEKGVDLLSQAAQRIGDLGAQLVILETSEKSYTKELKKLAKTHPHQVALLSKPDERLFHLTIAGIDMALFPSKIEPHGIEALYCLKYGTIPIARATGVFKEVVLEFDPEKETGNGFLFQDYTVEDFVDAVKRALAVYQDSKKWQKLMRNALKQNFSWTTSATKFSKLYAKMVGNKK